MATFTVNTAAGFDFLSITVFDLFNYANESKSATLYRFFDDAANFTQFTGAGFTFVGSTPDVLTGGTVAGFSRTIGGAAQYTFSGLAMNAATFEGFRNSGDTIGFLGNILTGNDTINGGNGPDVLFGIDGNDRLDGKLGADVMYGGLGNDTYVVDNIGDVVSDEDPPLGLGLFEGGGTDTVESSISYALPFFVENLTLTGVANIDATGSLLPNVIKGNAGNNIIDGGFGNDVMQGGAGNDTYYVDNDGDAITDTSGFDVVFSASLNYTMGSGVENGTLYGTGAQLQGNGLNNVLTGSNSFNLLDGAGGNDTISGLDGFDQLKGGDGNDSLDGGAGDDFLAGGNGNDILLGGAGNDWLDYFFAGPSSAAGVDTMTGGLGNDFYRVDNVGDVVTELAGQGTERVFSSINYTLTANVEDLYLDPDSVTNLSATGNALANKIFGNKGHNQLNGLAGVDQLFGGDGNDTYTVADTGDLIVESATPASGTDLVLASVNYTLSLNVENLTLTGLGNINGRGNSQVNRILGNAGDNILDGQGGADNLQGGLGNDTYIVDHAGDVVSDSGGTADLIKSSVTVTLGTGVENLLLTGINAINGTGNILNNIMTGNSAANTLVGDSGSDTLDGKANFDVLTGGLGADKFVFSALSPLTDLITDFTHLSDDIVVSAAAFGGGLVAGGAVVLSIGAAVGAGVAQMVYNPVTGNLVWDVNGSTAGGATLFAELSSLPVLTAADFVVIA